MNAESLDLTDIVRCCFWTNHSLRINVKCKSCKNTFIMHSEFSLELCQQSLVMCWWSGPLSDSVENYSRLFSFLHSSVFLLAQDHGGASCLAATPPASTEKWGIIHAQLITQSRYNDH